MHQVRREWLGNELANGTSKLQEESAERKAEKVSGDARGAPSQADNTDMFAGVHGTTYGRGLTEGRARKCPLLEERGSRLRLPPFASSYLVRSRARRSPAGHLAVQPAGLVIPTLRTRDPRSGGTAMGPRSATADAALRPRGRGASPGGSLCCWPCGKM